MQWSFVVYEFETKPCDIQRRQLQRIRLHGLLVEWWCQIIKRIWIRIGIPFSICMTLSLRPYAKAPEISNVKDNASGERVSKPFSAGPFMGKSSLGYITVDTENPA